MHYVPANFNNTKKRSFTKMILHHLLIFSSQLFIPHTYLTRPSYDHRIGVYTRDPALPLERR